MDDRDERVILTLNHEVEGELVVVRKSDSVRVRMRWPFDLMEDDFVEIAETFTMHEWQQAIDTARGTNGDTLSLRSESGAFLRIDNMGELTHIEVASQPGPMFRSIRLAVPSLPGLPIPIDG